MTLNSAPRVEPLGPQHDRAAFSCGEPALDAYFQRQAMQDVRRGVARVFAAVGATPHEIAGYYSLSAAGFAREDLSQEIAKRLPRYPVPAAILGCLAVDRARQGQRLGEFLLLDAMRRVLRASAAMAVYAVVVDAKSEDAERFYRRYGFRPFPNTPLRLFLPLEVFVKGGL